jgi:very-short-patch-repair endonuclease
MSLKYNKNLVKNAQLLRKNMTKEEKHLWYDFLKKLPITVNRQKNIGNFIVDFFIASKNIVIELDGSQHFEDENKKQDFLRDAELAKLGIRVLRYQNIDINKHFYSVCAEIAKILEINIENIEIKN